MLSSSHIQLIGAVTTAGAMGVVVGLWMIKREFNRIFEAADRTPDKDWFIGVSEKLNSLPCMIRQTKTDQLIARVDDHENRIRVIEGRK